MANLEIIPRNGIFYACGSIGRKRFRKSLGTRDKARARELCAQLEARLWKRDTYGEEAVRTFNEAAESYMTATGNARFLKAVMAEFGNRLVGSIKPEEVRMAARRLLPGRKPATMNRQVIVPARAVINHAAGLGWCHKLAVKLFPTEKARRRSVDRAWIDAFTDQADADGMPGLSAAILFMWQTGARVSETVRIVPEHINLAGRVVLLEQTKTGEWEPCHITRELMIRMANLPQLKGSPAFGYPTRFHITHRMKAVCARAGIPYVSPHQAGRHSFATNALAQGASLKEVMEGGRWKSARLVLETYAHADHGGRAIADRFDANLAQPNASVSQVPEQKGGK